MNPETQEKNQHQLGHPRHQSFANHGAPPVLGRASGSSRLRPAPACESAGIGRNHLIDCLLKDRERPRAIHALRHFHLAVALHEADKPRRRAAD